MEKKQNEIKKNEIKKNEIKKKKDRGYAFEKVKEKRKGTEDRRSKKEPAARKPSAQSGIKRDNSRKKGEQEPHKKQGDATKSTLCCPVYKKCGGCQLQGLPYPEQLKAKQKQLQQQLGKYVKTLHPISGMENPLHYRNKVHAVFDRDKRGNPISGVYQSNTHKVVPVESCMIEDQKADQIIQSIRGLLKSFRIRTYDEDTGYGLLRHVLVKRGFQTGEIMVVLVTASPVFPSKNNFVKALREIHPDITTIIQNINGRGTSMVLGAKENVLYGKGYIEDLLCGLRFRISSQSFYQVNPVQTEVLYGKAIQAAGLTGKERVIDAYCGIGTIGLIASHHAGQVIGIELNKDAVKDAICNAKVNQIENVRFFCADAGEFMVDMAQNGEKVDVVFMDPPRSGSTEVFIDSVVRLAPDRVVYISCNPDTLVRDLEYFKKMGYVGVEGWGVDMFCFTNHVETVVLLSHKKPDSHINVKVEFGEGEGKVPLDKIAERAENCKPKERVTYKMIKEYIEAKHGFKVHTAYIAEVKRDLGLPVNDAPNAVEELKNPRKHPTQEKVEAIKGALKHFEVI